MFPSAGSRAGPGALNTDSSFAAPTCFYAGANTSKTYDPGVAMVALDSCSITLPPASYDRTFKVRGSWVGSTGFTTTHGVRSWVFVDGAAVAGTAPRGWSPSISGEHVFMNLGPQIVVIPGDGASHTIALQVADSGATGNLTFLQRWITAQQMAPG